MAEHETKKRGRPRKAAVAVEVTPTVTEVVEDGKSFMERTRARVTDVVGLDATTKESLVKLGKGVLVASADAAVVYVKDNLGTVNFGKWNGLVQSLGVVALSELRNLLHGGVVSGEEFLEAIKTQLTEAAEKAEKAEKAEECDEEETPATEAEVEVDENLDEVEDDNK